MKGRPLLSFTICWIGGSTVGCLFSGSELLIIGGGGLLLLMICAARGRWGWRMLAILGLALAAAAAYWEWNEGRNVSRIPAVLDTPAAELQEVVVEAAGVIVSPVERDGDRVDFVVKLSRIEQKQGGESRGAAAAGDWKAGTHGGKNQAAEAEEPRLRGELVTVQVKLQAESEIGVAAKWHRGDHVLLEGELEQPAESRNFGGFDYREYLQTHKIHWLVTGSGTASVKADPPDSWKPSVLLRWNDEVRNRLGAGMDRLFQGRHSGYMKGLVIGIQDELDPETFRQFSQLGLTHILAISGMHVAVYVGVLLFVFRRLRLTRETAVSITLMLVPVYVLISGAGPSVVRAGIMSMIALLAARAGILKDGLNILAASALIMLVWNPYFLQSVSFQLSFLVTAGLMVYVPLITPALSRLPRWLGSALSVTLIAQLISFPLTIYYFNQFSLLSFAANLVLVPFITFLVLPLGTLALVLGMFWTAAAGIAAQGTKLLNNATFAAVEWINGFAGSILIWRSPSLLWICCYYGLLYGLLYALKWCLEPRQAPQMMDDETKPLDGLAREPSIQGKPMGWGGAVVLLCAAGLGLLLYRGYQMKDLKGAGQISYLDVGLGDSILITTPEGAHILVDGGGTLNFGAKEEWRIRRDPFEIGKKLLLPLLKQRGIHRLDAVILTHGDQDHAGGLQAVLEGIPVSALLFNGALADTEPYRKLMRTALAQDVRLYSVQQGMTLAPDMSSKLYFVWPEAQATEQSALPSAEDQNHESVAFRLEMNGKSFLFTGDMDKAVEEAILKEAEQEGAGHTKAIDILKIAHHGSMTATGADWLTFWKPQAAVISAGVNNLYGHPSAEVLDRLTAQKTAIYRTDLQGEIQMQIRREGISVRSKFKHNEPTVSTYPLGKELY